jgi:hypothetical protein
MLEDAIPISIGTGTTKSAQEQYRAQKRNLSTKVELTKEEVQLKHRQRKRHIKAAKKDRITSDKEKRR